MYCICILTMFISCHCKILSKQQVNAKIFKLPVIEYMCSIGNKNGLSRSRTGSGI